MTDKTLELLNSGLNLYLIIGLVSMIIFSYKVWQALKWDPDYDIVLSTRVLLVVGLPICGLSWPVVWGAYLRHEWREKRSSKANPLEAKK